MTQDTYTPHPIDTSDVELPAELDELESSSFAQPVTTNSNKMERTYQINNSTLRVVFGDITSSKTDVIVSSDDAFLSMGGGVSRAIKNAASIEIQKDTKKHTSAALGDVIVTSAVNLPHKYVFHAITISKESRQIKWSQRPKDSDEIQRFIIRHSVEKCCQLLIALGQSSIAFPAIGSGAAKIPLELVAQEMSKALTSFLFTTSEQLSIELYLMDRFGRNSDMDYIMFFEHIAIGIHETSRLQNTEASVIGQYPHAKPLVRCFMAGSTQLEAERNSFRAVVSKADNKWSTFDIKSYDYQDFLRSYQRQGHQSTYNEFIAEQTDFMIFVLTGRIGDKTKEELETAVDSFERTGHPQIFIYVQEQAFNNGVWDTGVQEWIENKDVYVVKYNTIRDLQHSISDDLTDYIIYREKKVKE